MYARDTCTPPQNFTSSSFTSPDQGYSSVNSSYQSSPQIAYQNYYSNKYDANNQYWQDYYNYYYNYSGSYYNYNNYYNYDQQNDQSSQVTKTIEPESPYPNQTKLHPKVIVQLAQEELKHDDDDEEEEERKRPRVRTQFSVDHRKYLLSLFSHNIYPTKEQLEEASQRLRMSKSIIQTWFKNTRSKQKKLCHTKNL